MFSSPFVKQNRALCFTQNTGAVVSQKIEYFRPDIVYMPTSEAGDVAGNTIADARDLETIGDNELGG